MIEIHLKEMLLSLKEQEREQEVREFIDRLVKSLN